MEDKVRLSRYLQWTAVSCMPHMRARKPAPEAYAAAAAAVGMAGADLELILIDDRKQNVQAAQACGWDGILFTSADALVTELRGRGIAGV